MLSVAPERKKRMPVLDARFRFHQPDRIFDQDRVWADKQNPSPAEFHPVGPRCGVVCLQRPAVP